jgi:hypothetical protein
MMVVNGVVVFVGTAWALIFWSSRLGTVAFFCSPKTVHHTLILLPEAFLARQMLSTGNANGRSKLGSKKVGLCC